MSDSNLMEGLELGAKLPPLRTKVSKYTQVVAAVKAFASTVDDPNDAWCRIPGLWSSSITSNWRNGTISGVEAGEFEAVVRNVEERDDFVRLPTGEKKLDDNGQPIPARRKLGELYVRYVGLAGVAEVEGIEDAEGLREFL